MDIMDIQQRVANDVAATPRVPEAVSVMVIATADPDIATAVGPLLAKRLYPTRSFGRVLHVEPTVGGFLVDVEVTYPLAAVTLSAGNGR